jgi:hypothetical protein
MKFIDFVSDKEFLWITLINNGYVNYCKNFLKSMELSNIHFTLIVYCIDKENIEELREYKNCICFDASLFTRLELKSDLRGWLDGEYVKITFTKLDAILYTLKNTSAKSVGYIDTDIVLFSDPTKIILEEMDKYPDVDIFTQCDENTEFCSNKLKCPNICSGVAVFRNNPYIYHIFEYEESVLKTCVAGDQSFILHKINHFNIKHVTIEKDIFINGFYQNGDLCSKRKQIEFPECACLVHFNYIVGSDKEAVMRFNNKWYL